ncbi:MBL fold metallo-hydrolase [Caldicellulosiruptor morganii]|uniref:MBL fold metallo-hydrolase n=1 Tax=Caldicellulosiruptor morganii TaxID=1387555 RepID=A0ABY7BRG8_9FIRM|nr:MBL fold metallo-hydrolase [Caldicellulosiruptor morganii]WAM34562.1 MBL fold metallo-hydrolase [Caldicellulosiruptor morganii]
MKNHPVLNFLGIGSAFNTNFNNTSAYFEHEDSLFLIDCGEGIFETLYKMKLLQKYPNINILITHTHPDHVATLGHLILYCFYELNKKARILFPEESLILSFLSSIGVAEKTFDLIPLKNSLIYEDKITIIPVRQIHVTDIPCFGYLIETEESNFFYSGDAKTIDEIIIDRFLKDEIKFLYQDTCSENHNGTGPHLSLEELSLLIPSEKRNRVFCIHLDSNFDFKLALSLGFQIPEQIQI